VRALSVILLLISIGTIVAPVGAVLAIYRNNLSQVVITPQIQSIIGGNSTILQNGGGSNNDNSSSENNASIEGGLITPVFISDQVNQTSRTFSVTANVTDSFNYNLTVTSFSADVVDSQDNYPLGNVSLSSPVTIPADQTCQVTVSGLWTQDAENHVLNNYPGATSIGVSLTNVTVEVNGVTIESSQHVNVGSIPFT